MENILMLIKAAFFFILIAAGILFMLFPIIFDANMKAKTGKGIINYGLTGIEMICLLGVITYLSDTSSDGFTEALGCLTIAVIVSIVAAAKKAKKRNLDKWTTFLVIVAQAVSPISILFIVFMIERLISDALGCKVIAYDVEQNNKNRHFPDLVEFVTFEQLLAESDILSIHCPLNQHTYHMFSMDALSRMKPSAYLINVSRGGIVDEAALYHILKCGKLAGAALDVAENEPLPTSSPLLTLDNLFVTPHSAWYSEESSKELKRKVAEEAVRFLTSEPVRYPVI